MVTSAWWRTPAPWVAGAVVLVVVAAAASVLGAGWVPVADSATIELLVRDVGSHTPLVGFNSRYVDPARSWNHPGPWVFWLLAAPYRLSGESSTALLVGAALINAAMVGALLWLAHRIGRLPLLLWTAFLTLVLVRAIGYETLRDPWNPWMAVLPFAIFVMATWGVVEDDLWLVPVAVLAGSFALDNHISYGLFVGAFGVWGLTWIVVRALRARRGADEVAWMQRRRRLLVVGVVSAALLAAFWAPVVYEQLTRDPGNITRTYRFFRLDDAERLPVGTSVENLAAELGLKAPWLGFGEVRDERGWYQPGSNAPWTAVITLGAFGATGVLAWRRRHWDAVRLHGTVAVGLLAALASVFALKGDPFPYLWRWAWVLGMYVVLAVGWALWRSFGASLDAPAQRRVAIGLTSAIAVLALVTIVTEWDAPTPLDEYERQARALVPPTVAAVDPDRPVVVQIGGGGGLWVPYGQLVLGLERAGIDARVTDGFAPAYKEHRVVDAGAPNQVVTLVEGSEGIDDFLDRPDQALIARFEPDAAERAENINPMAVFLAR